jgi:hypothetical protein
MIVALKNQNEKRNERNQGVKREPNQLICGLLIVGYNLLVIISVLMILSYKICTGPNEEDFIDLSTCYVIVDGGYLNRDSLMCGYGISDDPMKYKFSDWIASVRKDVECFFGILKQRFRFLVNPITLQRPEDVGNAFYTCCMIHNLILREDGLNTLWESGVNWKRLNPDPDSSDEVDIESNEDDASYIPTFHSIRTVE